ncbi:hypothetical protein C8Q70DRAFT_333362 [Cubamyces menziesii]|nr:hypothetical protein C8Q70DRAFT_333362 [Cubamyces menziesii]
MRDEARMWNGFAEPRLSGFYHVWQLDRFRINGGPSSHTMKKGSRIPRYVHTGALGTHIDKHTERRTQQPSNNPRSRSGRHSKPSLYQASQTSHPFRWCARRAYPDFMPYNTAHMTETRVPHVHMAIRPYNFRGAHCQYGFSTSGTRILEGRLREASSHRPIDRR